MTRTFKAITLKISIETVLSVVQLFIDLRLILARAIKTGFTNEHFTTSISLFLINILEVFQNNALATLLVFTKLSK